ncbi:MAG: hypothetical protein K0S61_4908 [Anaerocolumna sp.]|jgi:hypothetical protein|nr:hypothetical protein [Anaerocolumna sp.]
MGEIMKKMSLKEAKEFFVMMDCSSFVMARENLPKYNQYKLLNISREIENIWREEKLEYHYNMITNSWNEDMVLHYDKMVDLVTNIKTLKSLNLIKKATEIMINKLTIIEKIIVSETILGRLDLDVRSGLIFLSYDLGYRNLAEFFICTVKVLLDLQTEEKDLTYRIENAQRTYMLISNELGI